MAGEESMLVDKSESEKLTLASLQRIDNTIEQVIETANHVSLYEFNLDTKKDWKKRDVEGSLFVVKRSCQPRFQVIILNRLSPKNHVEDILATSFEMETSGQTSYIYYAKEHQGKLLGLWFYDQKECEKIYKLLMKISTVNKPLDDHGIGYMAGGGGGGGSVVPKEALTTAGTRIRSATTGSYDGNNVSNNRRSTAAEEISDLLGMLDGPGKEEVTGGTIGGGGGHTNIIDTTTTTTVHSVEEKRQHGNGSSRQHQGNNKGGSAGGGGGGAENKKGQTRKPVGPRRPIRLQKRDLKLALERVVQKDEFIEMLYTEIVNVLTPPQSD